jgi:hypothetical protein
VKDFPSAAKRFPTVVVRSGDVTVQRYAQVDDDRSSVGAHVSLQGADRERSNLGMLLRNHVASGGYCYLLAVVRERPHFDRSARDRAGRLRDEVNDLI